MIFNDNSANSKFKSYTITIEPRTNKVVKIPVNHENGVGILDYQNFRDGLEIPKAIVNIKNNFAITTLTNSNDYSIKLNILKPLEIEPLNLLDINFINQSENINGNSEQDLILKDNLKNIRLDHCNSEEKQFLKKLCFEYRDIFHCEDIPLSFANNVKHKINLKNETPIFTKSYRFPAVHKEEVKTQINKMLKQGIIQDSISPWSSPVWIVPKKTDASGKKKWRLVIDYRKLNEQTIDDKYPLPNISDILDKLGRANYFTTIDLASGFHQLEVDPEDVPKTAFSTDTGHYEFKRMPFGLKNAPSTFQRVMNNVLRGLQNEICFVYIDDIIIFSTSLEEHLDSLRSVFNRLRKNNFKIQLDKTEFLRKEVQFLGHIITPDGVKPNPDKIAAIKNFPIPKTQSDIKSFLGLLGYYRRFIPNLAKIIKPMTLCLKKGKTVTHDKEFLDCFHICKNLLINEPILKYPDFDKPFILTTDASNFAIGAVLSQGELPHDRPVAYASRTLNDSEVKYSTIEKELLAIVWACKQFRPYLYGKKFKIYTDHRPLTWLFNIKEPNSKLVRWRLKLEEYEYEIIYKKGKHNTNADCLSRIELNTLETESTINNPGEINNDVVSYLKHLAENITLDDDEPSTSQINNDKNTQKKPKIKIISNVQICPPNKPINNETRTPEPIDNSSISDFSTIEISDTDESVIEIIDDNIDNNSGRSTVHSTANETTNDGIKILDEIINNKTNQIHVFPNVHFKMDIAKENYENQNILKIKIPESNNEKMIINFLKDYTAANVNYYAYFHNDKLYKDFCKTYLKHFSVNGPKIIKCTKLVNTIADKDEQILFIKFQHEGKTNHRGINETLEKLKRNYYWKNMKVDITNFINECEICQREKYARKSPYVPLMLTNTPTKPFQIIHIDVFTFGNRQYLTIVDAFSKFAQAIYIEGKTAIHISNALIKYFTSFGVPQNIVADNGKEFKNEIIKDILNLHKIKVHFTTPYHHESNSIVERFHSTIIEHLRILQETHSDNTKNLMDYAIIAYNNSIHSSTNYTPFELTFGHTDSRNPNDIFIPNTFYNDYVENHKEKLKHVYKKVENQLIDKKEKIVSKINTLGNENNEFYVGQNVFRKNPQTRNKKSKRYLGKFIITKLLDKNRVEIRKHANDDHKIIVHIKELKKPPISDSAGSSSPQHQN